MSSPKTVPLMTLTLHVLIAYTYTLYIQYCQNFSLLCVLSSDIKDNYTCHKKLFLLSLPMQGYIDSLTVLYSLFNNLYSLGLGLYFAWSPNYTQIRQGDTVTVSYVYTNRKRMTCTCTYLRVINFKTECTCT